MYSGGGDNCASVGVYDGVSLAPKSKKCSATTNFGQKCIIENRERNTHRKVDQNRTTVKVFKISF